MPMYHYTCGVCHAEHDRLSSIAERDVPRICNARDAELLLGCGGRLVRDEVGTGGMIKPNGKYAPGVVFANGVRAKLGSRGRTD